MKKLFIILVLFCISSCSTTNEKLPKAPIVREAERTLKKAELSLVSGEFSTETLINNSLSLSIATNIPDLKIRAFLLKSHKEMKEQDFNKANISLETAKQIAQQEANEMIPYVTYFEIIISLLTNDEKKLNSLMKQKISYPENLMPSILTLKGLYNIKINNLEEALEILKTANKLAKKQNLFIEQSFSLKLIAYIQYKTNNLEDSLNNISEALAIDRALYLVDYQYWDLELIGKIYEIKGDNEKSLYYYKSAYELALANKNEEKIKYFQNKLQQHLK